MRTTRQDLAAALERLNAASRRQYRLYEAYSRVRLEEDGANITPLFTEQKLYDVLNGILRYVEREAAA